MLRWLWWLTGERRILATSLPQYRQVSVFVAYAGRCYRVTRVVGMDVWGRPIAPEACHGEVLTVESPLKHVRRQRMGA